MENQLKQMALRAALTGIMFEAPNDIGEGSDYLRWYLDTTGEVEKPAGMHAWTPFEDETDDTLREHIDMETRNMMRYFNEVLELLAEPVHELGTAIESGDAQAIVEKWRAIKPSVEKLLVSQAEDECSGPRP